MKYKVGDKVKIRSDLKVGTLYRMNGSSSSQAFVLEMASKRGKICEIVESSPCGYRLKNVSYWWTDAMFEDKVEEKSSPKFKVGDKVKIVESNVCKGGDPDVGKVATISTVRKHFDGRFLDYEVDFGEQLFFTHNGEDHENCYYRYYDEKYLEKVEEKKGEGLPAWRTTPGNYTFEIHSEGDNTKIKLFDLKNGEFEGEVSVKRYFKDDFDLLAAIRYGLEKLDKEMMKKETFKPGDIVEVLSAKDHGLPDGIHGEIVDYYLDGTWIVDFKFDYKSTHTCDVLPARTGLWIHEKHMKKVK